MIYDAVETVYTSANANFTADLTALAAAKGVTVTTSCTFVKRQKAETQFAFQATFPACGVYGTRAATQAKDQTIRDSVVAMVFDYYAEDTDPVKVAKQTELAAEALLITIDRLYQAGGGLYGAGEEVNTITVDVTDGYEKGTDQGKYWRRAIVKFPVYDRDSGL